jgi:hypothetical protein
MPNDATLLEAGPANVYFDNQILGYMGEELALHIEPSVIALTGAQAGTAPLDKVVSGGRVYVTAPLKEWSISRFAKSILLAKLGAGAASGRLDLINTVGLSARSLAKELKIVKIIAGVETTDPNHIIVFPEASPADSPITIPFSPTTQRQVGVTFEAWPNATTNRWGYMGPP